MRLKPSEILFSQDAISNTWGRRSQHWPKQIGETLDDICEGRTSISDIPTISVISHGDGWMTTDNRRLWVFQHLERLGLCESIPVITTSYINPRKMNTTNGGKSVRVRRSPGGNWYIRHAGAGSSSSLVGNRHDAFRFF